VAGFDGSFFVRRACNDSQPNPNGTDSIEGCFLSHCHILRFEAPALQDIVAAAQSTSNVNILLKIL
jgi:hypothetical protein